MANIMIVEDESIVARDIHNRLMKMGYDVAAVVSSGEDALETAPRVKPDLVLMDIMLKGELDGTQVAEQLYRDYRIPIVYLTAHADVATLQKVKKTQPFGYVVKPFQEQDLQTSIEIALTKHKSEEALLQDRRQLLQNKKVLESRVEERTENLQQAIDYLQNEIDTRRRTQEELKVRDHQLIQSQKMEEIGRLAGGVMHDFNNQLAIMKGYLDLVQDQAGLSERVIKYLDQIEQAVDRSAGLTRQLLMFSSQQPIDPKVVKLNAQMHEFQKMLERLLGEDVAIELDLDSAVGDVFVDPINLDQVVTNLAVNARDAMPVGGTLTIVTRNEAVDEIEAERFPNGRAGDYVRLSVMDTGTGMDGNVLRNIFEPFFTTKGPNQGTGLGLSVVSNIVQSHGGWIWAESILGKGSQFHVYLPQCDATAGVDLDATSSATGSAVMGKGERVLLIEDETRLREMFAVLLTENGYSVQGCGTLDEARDVLAQTPIDLILADVMLPDGNGSEMIIEMHQQGNFVRAVLMTGYSEGRLDLVRLRDFGIALIRKPVSMRDLLQTVQAALMRE